MLDPYVLPRYTAPTELGGTLVTILFLASGLFIFFLGMRTQSQIDDNRIQEATKAFQELQKSFENTRDSFEGARQLIKQETEKINEMRDILDKIISKTNR